MEHVADVAYAADHARLHLERLGGGLVVDLAAQLDDALHDGDVDAALRRVGVAEDLGLDLALQRVVVARGAVAAGRLVLRLGSDALRLRTGALGRALHGSGALAREAAGLVRDDLAPPVPRLLVEEIGRSGAESGTR